MTGILRLWLLVYFFGKWCKGRLFLGTKYSIANTLPNPKPAWAQTQISPNAVAADLTEGVAPLLLGHSRRGRLAFHASEC